MDMCRIENDKPRRLRRSLPFVTDGVSRRYNGSGSIGLVGATQQRDVLLSRDLCCASLRDSRCSRLALGKFYRSLSYLATIHPRLTPLVLALASEQSSSD